MTAKPEDTPVPAIEVLRARHARCFLDDGRPPLTDAQAAAIVDRRGFMLLGEIPRAGLPSLSGADESRQWNVSDRAWRWKETLPGARRCAYLKWFRGQGTFISWRLYPCFYRLWGPRYAGPEAYRAGVLGLSEARVLELIAEYGPVSSRELWRLARPDLGDRRELVRSLGVLQRRFYVSVAGGDLAGWSMHYWDLVERCVPRGLVDDLPGREAAQRALLAQAVDNLVYCTPREVGGLFGWRPADVLALATELASTGVLRLDLKLERTKGPCLATTTPPSRFPGRARGPA